MTSRADLRASRRIVVKVGTAVVSGPGGLALGRLGALVEQIHRLRQEGRQVLLVSSGAVGLGARALGFERRPTAVIDRQACASAGQSRLMGFYETLFGAVGERCAQVLLTEEDFHNRRRYVNLAATLDRLLTLGAIPVINENDTVSTAELALSGGAVFGDNDRLSALVASGMEADLLALLTDVDGLYTRPPGEPGAERIPVFDAAAEVVLGAVSAGGRGGMASKIASARVGATSGVHTVIAAGADPSVLSRIVAGEDVGTWFPAVEGMNHRRRWLAYATVPEGRLRVNAGAREALVQRQASLLAPGVVEVDGRFGEGAVVSLCDEAGVEFGRGICDRSADAVRAAVSAGRRGKALVHRDNVVILAEEGA